MPDFGRLLPFWAILIFGQGTLLRVRLTIHFLFLNPCPNGGVTLFVLPDMGSFSHLWAFVLFGQGIFLGESSNPFIARGGRLSFYSPCAEGTSICWLSKYDRQFHLIIPKEAQGWAVRRPSLSIEQPNIEHSLNSTWPWSATNMGLLAIRAERHTSTGVILWIFGCRLTAAQLALVSACEGFAQFTQALYKLKILLIFKFGSGRRVPITRTATSLNR